MKKGEQEPYIKDDEAMNRTESLSRWMAQRCTPTPAHRHWLAKRRNWCLRTTRRKKSDEPHGAWLFESDAERAYLLADTDGSRPSLMADRLPAG
ncbi:hypothetical protein ACNKHL_22580 [Shigella flexneri]